ncbi:hypothetical protein K0U83_09785, partial [bacterium]|nr:hypothetical protein [bacterium]
HWAGDDLAEWGYWGEGTDGKMSKAGPFIVKSQRPSGSGWLVIPKGKKGGYRRRKGKGYEYWYPDSSKDKKAKKPTFAWGESKYTEEQFASGDFDKDPKRWHFWSKPGQPPEGWTSGGVVADSKHPVKEAGRPGILYQIQDANAERGWARLKDVATGKTKLVQHFNVMPVHWSRKTMRTPEDRPTVSVTAAPEPPSVSGISEGAQRLPVFVGSVAKKGTALFKLENGYFVQKSVAEIKKDRMGNTRRTKEMRVDIDPQTKEKLISEFRGLIANEAKSAQKSFAVKSRFSVEAGGRRRDEALADIRMSAMEGFLTGLERYRAVGPFSAFIKPFVRSYARAQAAAEASGGFTLSERKKRLLLGYTAARAKAVSELDTDSPTPRQIASVWDLKKRDVHRMDMSDPDRNQQVPLQDYPLRVRRKGPTDIIDTRMQPGKVSMAEDLDEYLSAKSGLEGSGFLGEEEAALPTLGMGVGLTAVQRLEMRDAITKAAEGMDEFDVTLPAESGRQSTSYRVDAVSLIEDAFGLSGGDEMSLSQLASRAKIERKSGDGFKPVSNRGKYRIVERVLENALTHLRGKMDSDTDAGSLVSRATDVLVPTKEVKRGPTYNQILEARSRKVSTTQVREWRGKERDRLRALRDRIRSRVVQATSDKDREHQIDLANGVQGALTRVGRMSNREISLRIAHSQASRTTNLQRHLMTNTVSVEPDNPDVEYGTSVVKLTDPATGRQRSVRVRTFKDLSDPESRELTNPFLKSENVEGLGSGVLLDMGRFPRVMRLLWREDPVSTVDRFVVESLAGF